MKEKSQLNGPWKSGVPETGTRKETGLTRRGSMGVTGKGAKKTNTVEDSLRQGLKSERRGLW